MAITRARRQLVMVGDLETLGRARDRRFADLIDALRRHLTAAGDVRPSHELEGAVSRLAEPQ